MLLTRRGFVGTLGLGTAAGVLTGTSLLSSLASAQTREAAMKGVFDGGIMQLNQNESARGPGPNTMKAMHDAISKRVGRGYAPDYMRELQASIASHFDIDTRHILMATGSTPILQGTVRAFCSASKPLITAAPSFTTSEQMARQMGAAVEVIPVDSGMSINLDAMVAASEGAGMVYLCNPNNPSGTIHSPEVMERAIRQILAKSPDTKILVDEAYIDYVDPAAMKTTVPLMKEFKNIIVARTFSKAHGMAGLRIGYGLAHPDTLNEINQAWGMGDVNMLGAIAALTAFEDVDHIAWERKENAEIRAFTVGALEDMGFVVPVSHTNHIFPNLQRPASEVRAACMDYKIAVGRDFPPMQNTNCRISLGSREEMEQAVSAFRKVLS
jgi:histidinol-phosphate aminotransferase